MIGYSVSLCIRDIIEGKVKEIDVEKIIGSTAASNPKDWSEVVGDYRESYWAKDPDEAEQILIRLLAAGKVDQPRLRGEIPPGISKGIWNEKK